MTSNDEQSATGRTENSPDTEPTLLGEVLSLAPRLASRTIAQIQASQQIMSLLTCGRSSAPDPPTDDPAVQDRAMTEPVDVLGVIGDDSNDDPVETLTRVPEESVEQDALEAPDAADLVIPGYDSLAASQVVPRLTTLSAVELSAIGAYEHANRGRRTILNRVRQLLASANADS